MTMRYTTITYSGLTLDTFMTEDGSTWLTLSSLAKGVKVHQQSVIDWLRRNANQIPESIDVRIGPKRNVKATAYLVDIAGAFIDHMADKGNKECKALRTATLVADLDRSIREANGIQVTAAQHEEVRTNKRLEYLQQWVKDNYQPTMQKNGVVLKIDNNMVREAGFKDSTETMIVELEALIARREVYIASGKWGAEQCAEEQRGIERYRKDIQRMALSLGN